MTPDDLPTGGAPLLLLTTTGSKTGRLSTIPLVYEQDGDRLLIFGSKAGAPEHPHWYNNLFANPAVTVEVGAEKYNARAIVTQGEERERLFARQMQLRPDFAAYQAKTTRPIPVVALVHV